MPDILIKNLPTELHHRLKEEAAHNHRSMARHALALIEEGLARSAELRFPPPAKTDKPLTQEIVSRGIREGHR